MTVPSSAVRASMKALIAVLFAAMFLVGLQAPAAHAAVAVPVTLKVSTKAGTPLAGLNVYAYPVSNHEIAGDYIPANLVNGAYVFQDAGDSHALNATLNYAFFFDAPSTATTAFDQFWGGTTFVEESRYWSYGTDGTTLNLTLATNSTVTGKVTGLSSKALSGVPVYPWRWDGNAWYRIDNAKATTTSTGVYTMRNLEPGTYRLEFAPSNLTGYLSEFSGNTTVFGSAAPLTLGLGSTVSYNAGLVVGGSISGRVQLTDVEQGGNVLSYGVTARAYPYNTATNRIDTSVSYPSRVTGDDGKWTISGLPAGTYKVKTYDTFGDAMPSYVDTWLVNADHVGDAQVYTVAAGKTTPTVVSTMKFAEDRPDTSLELSILANDGTAIGNDTEVRIVSQDGEDFAQHFLLEGGTTLFPFVPTGSYTIYVDPHDGVQAPYIGTKTIVSGSANHWDITLPLKSGYAYTTPATIAQTASAVGTTYVVNPGHTSFPDDKVTFSYIWLRGDAPIFGSQSETSSSYTSRGVDLGAKISVIVRADTFGYPPVFSTVVATNAATLGAAAVTTTPPSISGPAAPVAGQVLTANPGTWSLPGLGYGYQWYRDSGAGPVAIAAATARTYTLTGSDADTQISVRVVAQRTGYADSAAASSGSLHIGLIAAPKLTKAATFSAVNLTGGAVKLTATPGTWSPAPSSFEYLWFADGVLLTGPGETGASVTCSAEHCAGKSIELQINAKKLGYTTATKKYVVRKGTTALVQTGAAGVADATLGGAAVVAGDAAQLGHSLTAVPQIYAYPNGAGTPSAAYQWYANGAAIAGATKQTYVPTTTVLNKTLTVRITVSSTLFPSGSVTIAAGTVRNRQDLVTGSHPSVAVDGTGLAGTTKRALLSGGWPVSAVTQTYQWYRCDPAALDCSAFPANWSAISKATASTYVPPASTPAGVRLAVRVTGSKTGYQSFSIVSGAFTLTNTDAGDVTAFTTPVYASGLTSGSAVVGRTLTVTQGALDRTAGVTRQLQWQLCNDAACSVQSTIAGATAKTYVPSGELLADGASHWIRFAEAIYVDGSPRIQLFSPPVPLAPGTFALTKSPALTLAPDGAQTRATVTPGTWPTGVTPSLQYQWFTGTTSVASGPSYSMPAGTTPVWVKVTAKRTGYTDLTFTLVARKGSLPAQTLTLTGAAYGDTLALAAPLNIPVNVPGATVTYQWYSGSSAISGATKATFVPSTAYVGKAITVRVKVTSPFYTVPAAIASSPVVLAKHAAPSGSPVIASSPATPAPGAKLSANVSSFGSGLTYTYKWERSADGLSGWTTVSTAATYTATTTDPGKTVRVTVTTARAGWNSTTATSAGVLIGYSTPLALTTPFVLSGTGRVDATLTAATAWNTTGYALSYAWTRNGATIPGASGPTVTPTASWIGDELQAHVTATKPGYQTVTVHSNEVRVAAAPAPVSSALTVTPTVPHVGTALTSSSGVWNVAGVTLTFAWYNETSDPGHATVLSTSATYTPSSAASYTVVVTAKRTGYSDGTVSKTIAVVP